MDTNRYYQSLHVHSFSYIFIQKEALNNLIGSLPPVDGVQITWVNLQTGGNQTWIAGKSPMHCSFRKLETSLGMGIFMYFPTCHVGQGPEGN